jgi:hypothetical protein
MLYIHKLNDLSLKSADIESTPLVRELKSTAKLPLSEESVQKKLSKFFISPNEIELMLNAESLIQPTIDEIAPLQENKELYELINLHRSIANLNEIPAALRKNIEFANEILEFQTSLSQTFASLISQMPSLRTIEDKKAADVNLSNIFEKVLRNSETIRLAHEDIIYEAQLARINSLTKSMNEGFFFHFTIEEHMNKKSFNDIKSRIPISELHKVEEIHRKLLDIERGVQAAHNHNMKMIELGITLYAYIKWIKSISK